MARYPRYPLAHPLVRVALLTVLASCGLSAHAQLAANSPTELATAPREGERLSDWLLRQAPDPMAFPTGLLWQVPGERLPQARHQRDLLAELSRLDRVDASARTHVMAMVEALAVTGRVRVAVPDARWLQAHPKADPLLQRDHTIVLPLRPVTVTVITQDGTRCSLQHQPGALALDYLKVCEAGRFEEIDQAWVIQPDGRVYTFGIAAWNEQAQSEIAPGALIWAPTRSSAWPAQLSEQLAQFLATQSYASVLAVLKPHKVGATIAAQRGPARETLARPAVLTANDWGTIGLLQMPTARMAPAGDARFSMNRVYPYERINVFLQPFDALEVGFRYTSVVNRLYGPAELSGNQSYKDKSTDLKLRLLEESANLPQVALGVVDFGGTGLFSSEYVVANKRLQNFDVSVGMGWGYMGSRGNIKNPLSALSSRFTERTSAVGLGGTPSLQSYFRGPTSLFGGVQYHTPWNHWVLKAEYDGNDYHREPQGNNFKPRTPFNLGLVYRPSPSVDVSVGVERGNTLMFGLTLHTSVAQLNAPKVSDAPTPRVFALRPQKTPEWTGTAADVYAMSGWGVQKMTREGQVLRVVMDGASGAHWNDRIERIVAVLHRDAPASIDTFELILTEQGVALSERVIQRAAWVKQNTEFQPPSAVEQAIAAVEPRLKKVAPSEVALWAQTPSRFGYGIVPSWQQNIGGPDGFLLFRAGVAVPMRLKLADNVSISGALSLNVIDNFGHFKYTAPSNMPRVRTYLREYMTTSQLNLPNLQITHFGALPSNQYYSLYAGYLESMYAGVGGEWLYRPWHSPLAFGVDVNRVQQRNFNQFLGFDAAGSQTGYRVTTGHATAYWNTGWKSTNVKLSVGRYLAGDIGATVDVGKTFDNGVSVGAWVTRTNVSAERFGEGSYDKGLYLRIPFDVMTTTRSSSVANLSYNPLIRDGGARLNREFTLFGATTARSQHDTSYAPVQASELDRLN